MRNKTLFAAVVVSTSLLVLERAPGQRIPTPIDPVRSAPSPLPSNASVLGDALARINALEAQVATLQGLLTAEMNARQSGDDDLRNRTDLTSANIVNGSLTGSDVQNSSLTGSDVQANSLTGADIANLTASDISTNIVSRVDGVISDGGNIDLVAGQNVTITPNNALNRITIAAEGVDTRYHVSGSLNRGATLMSTPTKIGDFLTFTKQRSDTTIEVIMNSNVRVGPFFGSLGAEFLLRVDNLDPIGEVSNVGNILTQNTDQFLSILAVFPGLNAGTHTVSVWGAGSSSGLVSGVILDPGGWGGRIIVREVR